MSGPCGQFFEAANLAFDAGDHAQQHKIDAAPRFRDLDNRAVRHEKGRQRGDQKQKRVQIEQRIERERAKKNDHGQPFYIAPSTSRRMRACAKTYFRYSANSRRAGVKVRPPGLGFHLFRYDGECNQRDVRQADASSSAMARGMCQFDVTTISELKLCWRAQRFVSSALPKVLSAERSRSMQQVKYFE